MSQYVGTVSHLLFKYCKYVDADMSCMHMGVSKNNGTPQISHFYRVFHYKPSILGYPYFWKHPYTATCFYFPLNRFFLRPGVWRTCCRNSEFWRRFVAETIWRKKQVSQAFWRMKEWTNEGFTASIFAKSSYLVIYPWILWETAALYMESFPEFEGTAMMVFSLAGDESHDPLLALAVIEAVDFYPRFCNVVSKKSNDMYGRLSRRMGHDEQQKSAMRKTGRWPMRLLDSMRKCQKDAALHPAFVCRFTVGPNALMASRGWGTFIYFAKWYWMHAKSWDFSFQDFCQKKPSEMPLEKTLRRTWGCQSAPTVSSLEEAKMAAWPNETTRVKAVWSAKLQGEKAVTRAGEGREISQDLLASVSFNFAVGCDLAHGRPRKKASLWRRWYQFFFWALVLMPHKFTQAKWLSCIQHCV